MKLTEAQRLVLTAPIFEHFDVWRGYWFTTSEDGGGANLNVRTVDALKAAGLIERGESRRVFSGRRVSPWHITPAGRQALATSGGRT